MLQPPISTYRIQLHKDFTFGDLEQLIDYLHVLGINTVYASPLFSATPGSQHGYDVTDPQRLNPEIGTMEQWANIRKLLDQKGMQWLQDIVPNHMAFSMDNPYLFDAFERGPRSPYYRFFDIDWEAGKVMVPFLGKPLQEAITLGEISLVLNEKGLLLQYFSQVYPLSVSAYALLTEGLMAYRDVDALEALLIHLKNADGQSLDQWQQARTAGFEEVAKDEKIQKAIARFNENKPAMQQLVEAQYYRLAHWPEAAQAINFRRFFTVNSLLALRMEDEQVFADYHRFIKQLYDQGLINGLRIDHIDGLQDPDRYLERLRALFGEDCYIIAEKILEAGEEMPANWPLQGTSGYEFLSYVSWLLTNTQGAHTLVQQYQQLLPEAASYGDAIYNNKKRILVNFMGGEWENLTAMAYALGLVPAGVQRESFKLALAEFMICLPVYRLYPTQFPLPAEDLCVVHETIQAARARDVAGVFELNLIASWWQYDGADALRAATLLRFLQRMMQFTGPLTAKGVEDTTFYQYNALLSHNEVGDAPDQLQFNAEQFHALMQARAQQTPAALNTTATHDTKRGEDARLRLNLLTTHTGEWEQLVARWQATSQAFLQQVDGQPAPTMNDAYFIYQSILAGFPPEDDNSGDFADRLCQYFIKAVREGKVNSNWEQPNEAYEAACQAFIRTFLDPAQPFLHTFLPFAHKIIKEAAQLALSQVVLKCTAPGIPDVYQGCELWDLSFVDPDNRRPVNYNIRKEHLQRLQTLDGKGFAAVKPYLDAHRHHGVEKMYVLWKSLQVRNSHPLLFATGAYRPIPVPEGYFAFARQLPDQWALVVVSLPGAADSKAKTVDLELPAGGPGKWENVFTGNSVDTNDRLSLAAVLQDFPVTILVGFVH